MSDERGNESGC